MEHRRHGLPGNGDLLCRLVPNGQQTFARILRCSRNECIAPSRTDDIISADYSRAIANCRLA